MENEVDLDVKAQAAYEAYWQGLLKTKPTPWWSLHEAHRKRWHAVVRAIKNRKRKTNV